MRPPQEFGAPADPVPASALGKPNTYSQSLISHSPLAADGKDVSLESALMRVAAIQTWTAPPAPPVSQPAATTGSTFQAALALWDRRATNPFPGGRPIQDVISRDELIRAGIAPLAGDAVHVELPT
jgi:hypothetical protein